MIRHRLAEQVLSVNSIRLSRSETKEKALYYFQNEDAYFKTNLTVVTNVKNIFSKNFLQHWQVIALHWQHIKQFSRLSCSLVLSGGKLNAGCMDSIFTSFDGVTG